MPGERRAGHGKASDRSCETRAGDVKASERSCGRKGTADAKVNTVKEGQPPN